MQSLQLQFYVFFINNSIQNFTICFEILHKIMIFYLCLEYYGIEVAISCGMKVLGIGTAAANENTTGTTLDLSMVSVGGFTVNPMI